MAPKPNRKIRPRQSIGLWMLVLLVFIAEMMLYAWSRVQCVRLGYGISAAIDQQKELQLLQKNFKIELARLKSPERIAQIARGRLNLRMPTPEQTIIIP